MAHHGKRPKSGGPVRPGRRPPPPEQTGAESAYFDAITSKGGRVVVHLRDGERLEGVVGSHDREVIELHVDDGTSRQLRKVDIRYLHDA